MTNWSPASSACAGVELGAAAAAEAEELPGAGGGSGGVLFHEFHMGIENYWELFSIIFLNLS